MKLSDSKMLISPTARRDNDHVTVCLFGAFFAPLTDAEARALIEQLRVALAHSPQESAA